ncbi:MAG TPA: TraR/DksA family transcriptional regulator [Geobacteraceae bacterium]|nr:TraR/DksA family transcriptional regulator [Geobacteraceae bacterium]
MARTPMERQSAMKEVLFEEKRRLWADLRMELFREQEKLNTQFEIPQDTGDMGMMDLLADTGLAVSGILREKLSRMEEAVRKLEEGSYGICEDCGEDIPVDRLRVEPFAICCVKCQEKREGPSYPPGAKI